MNRGDDDECDATCVHCGAPIYFEIGIGSAECPRCGKDYSKTDAQAREERIAQQRMAHALSTGEEQLKRMIQDFETAILFGPYDSMPGPMRAEALRIYEDALAKTRALAKKYL
jgi:uncharacterized Zn finger protein (UPF0148 family)